LVGEKVKAFIPKGYSFQQQKKRNFSLCFFSSFLELRN